MIGKRKGISVDIFWTGIAGWGASNTLRSSPTSLTTRIAGVRLPPDYEGDLINGSYLSSRVKRGAPLAVYAGPLLLSPFPFATDS